MSLERIKALSAERDRLMVALDRSLAIRALWRDAFGHGRATSAWIGAPLGWRRDRATGARYMLYALRLRVTDGAGESREFPQSDVPQALWPHTEAGRLP